MLHMRGAPGMGSAMSPNALVLPERLKSLPLLTLGAWAAPRSGGRDAEQGDGLPACRAGLGACWPPGELRRCSCICLRVCCAGHPSCPTHAGLSKTAALRGGGRDVNSDERTAVGHQMVACSVYDMLRLVYPSCYPVYEVRAVTRCGTLCWCSDVPAAALAAAVAVLRPPSASCSCF